MGTRVVFNSGRFLSGTWRVAEGGRFAHYDADGTLVDQGEDWCSAPSAEQLAAWQVLIADVAARWAGRTAELERPVFIRFGSLPAGGRSRNHITGRLERGVSCYSAAYNLLTGAVEIAGDALEGAAILASFGLYGNVALLLTGEEVGTGSDGEPLVRRPTVVAQLRYDETLAGFVPVEVPV